MRLHLRSHGFTDWPATLGCLAVTGAIAFCSHLAARELSVAVWKATLGVTAITVAIGAGSPPARASFVRGIFGFLGPLSPLRSAAGVITHSEAERDLINQGAEDDFNEVTLSVRARYVVDVELEDGRTQTCVLLKRDWARLPVGTAVDLVWQGIWLRSISPTPDPDPASGNGEPH